MARVRRKRNQLVCHDGICSSAKQYKRPINSDIRLPGTAPCCLSLQALTAAPVQANACKRRQTQACRRGLRPQASGPQACSALLSLHFAIEGSSAPALRQLTTAHNSSQLGRKRAVALPPAAKPAQCLPLRPCPCLPEPAGGLFAGHGLPRAARRATASPGLTESQWPQGLRSARRTDPTAAVLEVGTRTYVVHTRRLHPAAPGCTLLHLAKRWVCRMHVARAILVATRDSCKGSGWPVLAAWLAPPHGPHRLRLATHKLSSVDTTQCIARSRRIFYVDTKAVYDSPARG